MAMGYSVKYRRYDEDSKPIVVIGYVTAIDTHDDLNTNDETKRQIVFSGITADGDQITVNVKLENADYIIACKAYKDGAEIRIDGSIKRSGAKWIMSSYTDLHIID
jgi:hypothetical protein